ncbi:histidine phosphatase family protein [Microbacterium sp. Sa4CUA7]|uniref:Histidine phosphatase family protein n=1 Tax=Microbacterium pullorum TaxID=2762236 RepID=A0ABR8S067_9MICO|nr:histidine phosphatase family protein [Microbacterium pullorum]MBD7956840.1 histidine phosphatase family protein [Microbacterium pullorum]
MSKTATVFLVRHAEALSVDEDDPELSSAGEEQARRLAERFIGVDVAAILHSPRRRASSTASAIHRANSGAEIIASELLNDRTPVPSDERREGYTDLLLQWLEQVPEAERDPDGVAIEAALRDLTQIARRRGAIIAVTHNFVIGAMVQRVLQCPQPLWTRLNSDNAGVTRIDCSKQIVLRSFNGRGP